MQFYSINVYTDENDCHVNSFLSQIAIIKCDGWDREFLWSLKRVGKCLFSFLARLDELVGSVTFRTGEPRRSRSDLEDRIPLLGSQSR